MYKKISNCSSLTRASWRRKKDYGYSMDVWVIPFWMIWMPTRSTRCQRRNLSRSSRRSSETIIRLLDMWALPILLRSVDKAGIIKNWSIPLSLEWLSLMKFITFVLQISPVIALGSVSRGCCLNWWRTSKGWSLFSWQVHPCITTQEKLSFYWTCFV